MGGRERSVWGCEQSHVGVSRENVSLDVVIGSRGQGPPHSRTNGGFCPPQSRDPAAASSSRKPSSLGGSICHPQASCPTRRR